MAKKRKGPLPKAGLKNNLVTRTQVKHHLEINLAEARVVRRMLCFSIIALNQAEGYGKKRGRRHLNTIAELSKEWKKIADEDGPEYADSIIERRTMQIVDGEF